jgi:hypothetical protein
VDPSYLGRLEPDPLEEPLMCLVQVEPPDPLEEPPVCLVQVEPPEPPEPPVCLVLVEPPVQVWQSNKYNTQYLLLLLQT